MAMRYRLLGESGLRVSPIELGFPHEFLARPYIRDLVYGGTYDQIVRPEPAR